jgi:hypothetical protein
MAMASNHENLTAAVLGPLTQLLSMHAPEAESCGVAFVAPSGSCGDADKHSCNLTIPHIAHVCACGASDHEHF